MATRADKERRVQELTDFVAGAPLWMVSDYRGLSVSEFTELRGKLREHAATLTVSKNTLFRRVLDSANLTAPDELLAGPSAITACRGDMSAAAKILWDAFRRDDSLVIRGGVMDGEIVDANLIERLSSLPSRDELLAQAVGGIAGPIDGLVYALDGLLSGLVYALQGRLSQMEESSAG